MQFRHIPRAAALQIMETTFGSSTIYRDGDIDAS